MSNAYFDCRKRSRMSRQTAAELLGVSDSSLASYEQGTVKRIPCDVIASMARIYKAPELKREYCIQCPLSYGVPIADKIDSMAATVLKFVGAQENLSRSTRDLVSVCKDNSIDMSEGPILARALKELNALELALSEVRLLGEQYGY